MKTPQNKMVDLNLDEHQDIPWFDLVKLFTKQAQSEGWKKSEIKSVLKQATKHDDYVHLVETIREYCKH